jgi:flagellar FliJ protein
MTRSERMQPVQKVATANERREAGELANSEQKLLESERKLTELKQYEQDYRDGFNARVSAGMGGNGLRDYQQFLSRLMEAIRQQTQIVARARSERDAQQGQWREAAQRNKAIDRVVDTWKADERRHEDRREQRDTDERATRNATRRHD